MVELFVFLQLDSEAMLIFLSGEFIIQAFRISDEIFDVGVRRYSVAQPAQNDNRPKSYLNIKVDVKKKVMNMQTGPNALVDLLALFQSIFFAKVPKVNFIF